MRAAGLHPIATLLSSQAVPIRSNKNNPANAALIDQITSRIAGVIAASKYVLCNYNIPRARVHDATLVTPGRRAATVSPLDDPEWVAVSSMVLKAEVADVMDKLQVSAVSVDSEPVFVEYAGLTLTVRSRSAHPTFSLSTFQTAGFRLRRARGRHRRRIVGRWHFLSQ